MPPELDEVQRGLRMAHPPDPDRLARERSILSDAEGMGFGGRMRTYLKLIGPGFLQSAMTLGSGSAAFALFAGAAFGYKLLWVAPVSMILGLVMMAAISYQTLSTGARPFDAMRRHAGGFFAWGWALGALAASVIWHFPQYSMASAVLVDMGDVAGVPGLAPQAMGFVVLGFALLLTMLYGRNDRLVRMYERILKYMVWGVVVCFGAVVIKTGVKDGGALARGFFAFEVPDGAGLLILSGLSAAVGINMVFLYPYSLLARGWGREHRRLARWDLYVGMFVPYLLATSLMMIATANVLHPYADGKLTPVQAAMSLTEVVGPEVGRIVFNLGILAMALSSITLHMLCAGFVCSQIFGWEVGSAKYRLAMLIPVPGVLGPVLWSDYLFRLALPTTAICGTLLPVAYVGFVLLQRNRSYLGDDLPRGARGRAWWLLMVGATGSLTIVFLWGLVEKVFG